MAKNENASAGTRFAAELLVSLFAATISLAIVARQSGVEHPDLNVVWLGYRHLLQGVSPYPTVISQPLSNFGEFGNALYLHPPGSLLTLGWLGYLDRGSAALALSFASAFGVPYLLMRFLRKANVSLRLASVSVLLLAVSHPWLRALGFGNIDAVALILLLAAFGRMLDDDPHRSVYGDLLIALLIGTAIAVKPTVGLMALAPLALGWRGVGLVAAAGAVAASLTAIGFVVVPESQRFLSVVLPFLSDGQPGVQALRGSIPSLPAVFGNYGAAPRTSLILISGAAFVGVLWLLRQRLRFDLVASAALLACASLLVPGYSFDTYQQFLVFSFPLFWLAVDRRQVGALVCFMCAAFTFSPLFPGFTGSESVDRFLGMRLLLGNALVMGGVIAVISNSSLRARSARTHLPVSK